MWILSRFQFFDGGMPSSASTSEWCPSGGRSGLYHSNFHSYFQIPPLASRRSTDFFHFIWNVWVPAFLFPETWNLVSSSSGLTDSIFLISFSSAFYVSRLVSQLTLWHHSAAYVYASAWTSSPPTVQDPEICCYFWKISYISRMINCKIHADLSVRLFPRAFGSEVPPPKVWKFQHFITIFSLTMEGISLFSCRYVLGHK